MRGALIAAALIALVASIAAGAEEAADPVDGARVQLLDQAKLLLSKGETARLAALVAEEGDPLIACQRYTELAIDFYWKERNVPAVVTVSQLGLDYCGKAAKAAEGDAALGIKGWRKVIAYNLGSFTWPGWNDERARPRPEDTKIGLDAARLNLRLALELAKPPVRLSDAHWLLGAQQLAASDYGAAEREFEKARSIAKDVPDEARTWMNAGWAGVAILLRGDEVEGRRRIEEARQKLMALGDDGKFFADQYDPAIAVFAK